MRKIHQAVQDVKEAKRKKSEKQKKPRKIPTSSESHNNNHIATEMDASDLNELETANTQYKGSIKKIDTTCKHLLNLDIGEGFSECCMKKTVCLKSNEGKCRCKSKNKIAFDDEGEIPRISSESNDFIKTAADIGASDLNKLEPVYTKCEEGMKKTEHIMNVYNEEGSSGCRMKETVYSENDEDECKHIQKINNVSTRSSTPLNRNNEVQYQEPKLNLFHNVLALKELLKDPDLEDTYRSRICQRIKLLKIYHKFDLIDEKANLIKLSKINPDDVLNFKGTNLCTLSGYSIY